MVVDCAVWNSLEAAVVGGRGLTAGCSAVVGMEWRVLLFGGSRYGRPRVDCRLQCSRGDGMEGFVVWRQQVWEAEG